MSDLVNRFYQDARNLKVGAQGKYATVSDGRHSHLVSRVKNPASRIEDPDQPTTSSA
jgi:hypothetical protein